MKILLVHFDFDQDDTGIIYCWTTNVFRLIRILENIEGLDGPVEYDKENTYRFEFLSFYDSIEILI